MPKQARWTGPSHTRRDGPENRVFVRGQWQMITEEEAAYFIRVPGGWAIREVPLVEAERKVAQAEEPVVEATKIDESAAEAEVVEPEMEIGEVEVLPEESELPEKSAPFEGSALEGESQGGFVKVTKPEEPRDAGFV